MRRVAARRSELQRVAACSGGAVVVCSFVCNVQRALCSVHRAACSGGGGVCSCSGGWWALLALTAGAPAVEVSRVTVGGETPAEKHLAGRLLLLLQLLHLLILTPPKSVQPRLL